MSSLVHQRQRPLIGALAATGLSFSLAAAHAATFNVTNTNDSGAGSLRQALLDANGTPGADTVNITATGTITLTGGQIDVSESTTITGPGASNLTITTNLNGRAIYFDNAGTVSISGLRFANSGAVNSATCVGGGALRFYATNATISQSVFASNTSGNCGGGALYFYGGSGETLTINDSTFADNTTSTGRDGGALYIDSGNVVITRSVFTGNSSGTDGGAIYQSNGSLTVRDCLFTNNTSDNGGAIARDSSYTTGTTISGSTFSGNFARSTTYEGGGALQLRGNGTSLILIENSTFTGNSTAGSEGSAIHLYVGAMTLRNVTISGNSGSAAGAVRVETEGPATSLTLLNTVITNTTGGPDISTNNNVTPVLTGTNSLVTDPGTITLGGSGNTTGVTPTLGALAFNGGLTVGAAGFTSQIQTMLPPSGSVLIEGGNNAAAGMLVNDQRGNTYARITGTNVDIGAVEVGSGPVIIVARPNLPVPTMGVFALILSTLLTGLVGALRLGKRRR